MAKRQETVKQARFLESGEVVVEDTFATEAELNGYEEEQMKLGIGAGERPVDQLPMFVSVDPLACLQGRVALPSRAASPGGGSPGRFRDCPGCGQVRVDTTKPHVHKERRT